MLKSRILKIFIFTVLSVSLHIFTQNRSDIFANAATLKRDGISKKGGAIIAGSAVVGCVLAVIAQLRSLGASVPSTCYAGATGGGILGLLGLSYAEGTTLKKKQLPRISFFKCPQENGGQLLMEYDDRSRLSQSFETDGSSFIDIKVPVGYPDTLTFFSVGNNWDIQSVKGPLGTNLRVSENTRILVTFLKTVSDACKQAAERGMFDSSVNNQISTTRTPDSKNISPADAAY